ncbi:MAG: hypothetical protein ACYDHO_06260 [Gaiellaceae bacterium]
MTIQDDPFISEILAGHVPERREIAPDWANVLRRAGAREQRRLKRSHRGLIVAFAAILLAMVVSVLAVSAENDWWFLRETTATPAGEVVVVATGAWEGHGWTLAAYRTHVNPEAEVCLALTPDESPDPHGREFFCGMIPIASESFSFAFKTGPKGSGFPPYVLAPLPGAATKVRIELTDGKTIIEAKTFAAPAELGLPIRFLAAPLPGCPNLERIVALDDQSNVVAQSSVLHQPGTCPGERPWSPPGSAGNP